MTALRLPLGSAWRRVVHAALIAAALPILASCQATQGTAPSSTEIGNVHVLGTREIALPPHAGSGWRVVAERSYAARLGTQMKDVVLLATDGTDVRAIVWATSNASGRTDGSAAWQSPGFCDSSRVDKTRDHSGVFWQGQDCWGVKFNDPLFAASSNPTVKQLSEAMARDGLTLPTTIATVSYRYANENGLLEVTYGFDPDHTDPLKRPFEVRGHVANAELLPDWADRFHIKVRLGFHGILANDDRASTSRVALHTAMIADERLKPTQEGTALPSTSIPLSHVQGLVGDVPSNDPATVERIARNFESVVFQSEFRGPDPWLRKWNVHPKLRLSLSTRPQTILAMSRVADQLRAITGLDFSQVKLDDRISHDPRTPRNTGVIAMLNGEDGISPGDCYGRVVFRSDGTIASAVLFMGSSHKRGGIDECVAEEMAQALGPMNDTVLVSQSMFNDQTNGIVTALTWHDAVILRTLYDERLKPGMPKDRAMPVAREIIREVLQELH